MALQWLQPVSRCLTKLFLRPTENPHTTLSELWLVRIRTSLYPALLRKNMLDSFWFLALSPQKIRPYIAPLCARFLENYPPNRSHKFAEFDRPQRPLDPPAWAAAVIVTQSSCRRGRPLAPMPARADATIPCAATATEGSSPAIYFGYGQSAEQDPAEFTIKPSVDLPGGQLINTQPGVWNHSCNMTHGLVQSY
jgi:hypothetical protein